MRCTLSHAALAPQIILALLLLPGCPHDLSRLTRDAAVGPDAPAADSRAEGGLPGDGTLKDSGPGSDGKPADGKPVDAGPADGKLTDGEPADTKPTPDMVPPDGPLPADSKPKPDASLCGNGVINSGEQCDGAKLGSKTCKSLGFKSGALWCSTSCKFNKSGCYTVTKPNGYAIGVTSKRNHRAAVVYTGANYLVAWQTRPKYGLAYGVQAARVTPGAKVLGTHTISGASQYRSPPQLAFDGTNTLVVWSDAPAYAGKLRGQRVNAAGAVLGKLLTLSKTGGDLWGGWPVFHGGQYLVVWGRASKKSAKDWNVHLARSSPAGVLLATADKVVAAAGKAQQDPAMACAGSTCLVAWRDNRTGKWAVRAQRVSTSGALVGGNLLLTSTGDQYGLGPSVAWDGSQFIVVWGDTRAWGGIYGARVTAGGAVLDNSGIAISAGHYASAPRVAASAGRCWVVWDDYRSKAAFDIYGARVTPQGTVLDKAGIPLSTASGHQRFPAIACSPTGCLAVWHTAWTDGSGIIYGTPLTP